MSKLSTLVKRSCSGLLVVLVGCVGLLGVPGVARGDEVITSQPYVDSAGIPQLHAQGLDGEGVTIAILDTPVDDSVPELAGVDIEHHNPCGFEYPDKAHGTMVASILASPYYGWAPKAKILSYAVSANDVSGHQGGPESDSAICKDGNGAVRAFLNQALNDGADIVSISMGGLTANAMGGVIRAADLGVPVVVSAGNDSLSSVAGFAAMSYTVGVGAVDGTGAMAKYSNRGDGMSIVAYGGPPFVIRDADDTGALTRVGTQNSGGGTSAAAPMVAGALALAMQRWPDASGNQLLRVMADTADGVADHVQNMNEMTGEGMLLNAPLLIATDPSGYQDTNPYAEKMIHGGPAAPTPQDVQDYRDGVMSPRFTVGDPNYIFRGCDDSTLYEIEVGLYPDLKTDLYTAAGCEGSKPDEGISGREISGDVAESKSGWIGAVVGGVVVLLVAGLIIGLVVWPRRRSRVAYSDGRPPATPYPPGQHPGTAAYPPEQYPRTAAYPPTQHPGTAAYPPGQFPQPVPNQYPPPGSGQFPPPGSGRFPDPPSGYPGQSGKE